MGLEILFLLGMNQGGLGMKLKMLMVKKLMSFVLQFSMCLLFHAFLDGST
jgi:hypothetical protein